jgi:hypothetical protein
MLSEFEPMATATNWNHHVSNQRPAVGWWEPARAALKEAAAAFSPDEWQPWRFRIQDRLAELFMGQEITDDAESREGMIRCGMALQTLKLSLQRQHCLGRVNVFPELDQPRLIARVHVSEPGGGSRRDAGGPADSGPPLTLIQTAAAGQRCWLELAQCERSRKHLAELAGTDGHWLFRITGATGGARPARRSNEGKFSLGLRWRPPLSPPGVPEATSEFAVIKTKTDDKHGWIAAGQTIALLLHTASQVGVACTFFMDSVRKVSTRHKLRMTIGHKGFGQAIVQLTMAQPLAFNPLPLERSAISERNYS